MNNILVPIGTTTWMEIELWTGLEKCFSGKMACRRIRLPYDISGQYLHKKNMDNSQINKVAKCFNIYVSVRSDIEVKEATKYGDGQKSERHSKKVYQQVHVSSQSTSSCNFSTVNDLNIREKNYDNGNNQGKQQVLLGNWYEWGAIDVSRNLISNLLHWSCDKKLLDEVSNLEV